MWKPSPHLTYISVLVLFSFSAGCWFFIFRIICRWFRALVLLRSEIPSGICAKLRTVAASNSRVHMPWSLYYCLFAPRIYMVLFFTHIPFVVNHTINATPRRGCNSITIHVQIHHHFSSCFLSAGQWPLLTKFPPWLKPQVTPMIITKSYNKCKKDIDMFKCPRRIFNFSWKKWTCNSKRGRMVALLSDATHTRPVQIWVRQTQNLPDSSRDQARNQEGRSPP